MLSNLLRYHLAAALASLAMGVQMVVVPWIAAGDLQLSSLAMGWLQFFGLFPVVVLMLYGGALADKPASVKLLPWLYVCLALLHSGLLFTLYQQALIWPLLFVYVLMAGILTTLIQPLRDRVLPQLQEGVEGSTLQTRVIQMSLAIYVAQALGVALAGRLDVLGIEAIVLTQIVAVVMVALLLVSLKLNPASTSSHNDAVFEVGVDSDVAVEPSDSSGKVSIREGLAFVWKHRVLRSLVLLVSFNGFIHIGVYVVAMPLLVRDAYGESASFFASLQFSFIVGNIVAAVGLLKKGKTEQPGQTILFCLLYTGLIMLALSYGPSARGLYILIFFWGVVAGVSASLGKALLHEYVTDEYRGRALSVYFLALFGAAPLGALACGYTMQYTGPFDLFLLGGCVSLIVFGRYLFSRVLWKV